MGIGLSGMISGLDTDSIVKAMVSGQQLKATKIENKITLNKWTTDAWSGLNTKIYSFYTKYASKLRLQSSYMTRTAKSSNESIVTATAGSTAAVGTHSLQITNLASSQYVTGGQLQKNGTKADYNKNSKLTEIGAGVKAGTVITITGNKDSDKKQITKLEVTDKTTVNDFLEACKKSGLTASFDTTQQRFFISSAQSGADDAFSITTTELSENAANIFDTINDSIETSVLSATEKTKYQEAMSTLRQNVELIDDVLDSYDASNKTQKAVYEAIGVVKDAAAKTHEKNVADAAKQKAITEEDKNIEELLGDVVDGGDTTKPLAYGSTTFTFDSLFASAKNKVDENNKAAALKAGSDAVAKITLTKETDKAYAELSDVTKEKYDEAGATLANAKDKDGNVIALLETEIDNALTMGTISQETADALKSAYAVKNTWEASGVITGADGTTTTVTVEATYLAAYNASEEATAQTQAEDIQAEMINQLKADQKDTYNAAVNAKTEQFIEEADPAKLEEVKGLVETNLRAAATAGTTGSTTGGIAELGLGEITGSDISGNGITGMAVVAASNAEFVLDGANMTETSNSFTVNGITLNLASTTKNKDTGDFDTVQITVGKDGNSTYDLVKEALTEYNKLIEEMNKLYNADSARGYDPLTDEQKEAMTEDDIKNWEDKIKGSLLRRDNTLGTLLSGMRTALSSTYTDEETGKAYSLSSFGIVTGNYTENGKLHIYGDEDDALYATNADRLKKALEEDPDTVMNTLTHVFGKLYETMTEKCAKTEISSALTFYNDKQYNKLLKGYEKDLDKMEDRIKEMEDKYYKQFTAMEKAMSQLQSQQNSLASLLGQTVQ